MRNPLLLTASLSLACLAPSALLVPISAAEPVLLSDAEQTTGWESGTLISEAKVGAHSLRIQVPAGRAGGVSFGLRNAPAGLTRGGQFRFWYRFSGAGESGLMFKVVSPAVNGGVQTVWDVQPSGPASGEWRQATVDLDKGGMKWGNNPEGGYPYLYFRTNAPAGANLTLDLDDLVFVPGNEAPAATGPAATVTTAAPVTPLPAGTRISLADGETATGWDSPTVVPDARQGKGAIRFALPSGKAGALTLDLRRQPAGFAGGGQLRFWYRFSGTGSSSLMVKLQAHPLADGYQAVWTVASSPPADGQWHLGTVDLRGGYARWGSAPDTNSRYLTFRTESTPGSNLTLDVDDVALRAPAFQASVASARLQRGAGAANSAPGQLAVRLALINLTGAPLNLTAENIPISLAGGATQSFDITVPASPAASNLAPLQLGTQKIRVSQGDEESLQELTATFAAPLPLPAQPRLLFTASEVPAIKARIAASPALRATYDAIQKVAEANIARPVNIPDRGGQWWHHYACKKDGARLVTASPTQHRCPVCGTVYSGWPYDDVVLSNIHAGYSRAVLYLGMMYRLTGETKYAERAREILLAYAARYESYPEHDTNGKPGVTGGKIGTQKLDEAAWFIPVAQGADLIWDTLTAEQRSTIEYKLVRPLVAQVRNQQLGIHNIQNWQNSAVGLAGLLIDEPEYVAYAVNGEFGYRQQIAQGVSPEGQWLEGAWGYHFYAMNAMVPLLEAGERTGLNLYAYQTGGKSFATMFQAPLQLALPNYDLPAFNDSNSINLLTESNLWEGGQGSLYELALARYQNKLAVPLLAQLKRGSLEAMLAGTFPLPAGQTQAHTSGNYPQAGYAVLRQGTGKDALWLCLKYGPHGGGHGHFDKLNFVSYRAGEVLGYDPGTASYGVPIQEAWYRTSLAHNTLVVDETNQKPATGSMLEFADGPSGPAVLADAGPIADGLTYRRAVALCGPDAVLTIDLINADRPRTLDLAYHNSGKWSSMPTGPSVDLGPKPGYVHLKDMVQTTAPLPAITGTANTTRIAVHCLQDSQLLAGTGVGKNATDRVPCLITRVRGQQAAVATLITHGENAGTVQLRQNGNSYMATATIGGKTYIFQVDPTRATEKIKLTGP